MILLFLLASLGVVLYAKYRLESLPCTDSQKYFLSGVFLTLLAVTLAYAGLII